MTIWQDLRLAARRLTKDRGFTLGVVLTLALGIGASTSIFSVIDAVLVRPLPFAEPQRLTMVRPTSGARLSSAYLHDWRAESRMLEDMIGWYDERANLTGAGEPVEVLVDRTTSNFFGVLGVSATLGQTFTAAGDVGRAEAEVVLSHGFWQRQYGGAANVIGRPMTLDGRIHTIVGVMPAEFRVRTIELAESRAELWVPFALVPGNRTGMGGFLNVVARLGPGVTVEQAQGELSLIAGRIEAEYPSYSHDWGVQVVPLLEATVENVRLMLLVLFGAVGLLLVIACVNVASLVSSRAARTRTEQAIRVSLGATRGRLVQQHVAESVALAVAGGTIGVLLATWGTDLLVSALPVGIELPRTSEINVDGRMFLFACFVTILAVLLFGGFPALMATRSVSPLAVRDATRGSLNRHSPSPVGGTLIVVEVALALVLLAVGGLLTRSVIELTRVDPGFDAEGVLTARITLPASRYDTDEEILRFSRAVVERIGSVPGVLRVGFANYLPLSRFGVADRFEIDGRPDLTLEDQKWAWVGIVGGHYFDAMGIPLRRGRLPTGTDTERTLPVFVIDEELARRYWPDTDPIGARITWPSGPNGTLSGEIIGVVGRVRVAALAAEAPGTAYWWFPNVPGRELTIVARTAADPDAIASPLSAQVRAIDPNQPVGQVRAMTDLVSAELARPRFTMVVLGSFALAALMLAAIGLYSAIALAVTRRTREIGVRVALGAQRGAVFRLIVGYSVRLVGAGVLLGLLASLALGRLVASLLFGVSPSDPATLLAVTAFLVVVGTAATMLPARRALQVDPAMAMRAE